MINLGMMDKSINNSACFCYCHLMTGNAIEMQPIGVAKSAESSMMPSILREAGHPGVCMFHILFKFLAAFSYLIVYTISGWYVGCFILTTVFLAFDFWVTKNVSGRILAGLRWWSFVKEDGTSEWKFESLTKEQQKQLNVNDKRIFWYGLYFSFLFWGLLGVFNLVTLHANNFVICVIGFTFASSNLGAFRKCSNETKSGILGTGGWMGLKAMRAVSGV